MNNNNYMYVFSRDVLGTWMYCTSMSLVTLQNVTFGKNTFNQTSLDDDAIGACRITLESNYKHHVDGLYSIMPEVMIRKVEFGNPADIRSGVVIMRVRMKDTASIDYDANTEYPWKFTANAVILEWSNRNESQTS